MNRLTERIIDNVYYLKGKYPPATLCAEMETWEVRECMTKLAAYEDTGVEPEQIKQLNDAFTNVQKKLAKAFDDLFEYKDLEEQGLLIKLPCKVGDIVIVLECNVDIPYIKEEIVIAFELWNNNRIISLFIRTISGLYEANKTVFLTREEAEKALEEEKDV